MAFLKRLAPIIRHRWSAPALLVVIASGFQFGFALSRGSQIGMMFGAVSTLVAIVLTAVALEAFYADSRAGGAEKTIALALHRISALENELRNAKKTPDIEKPMHWPWGTHHTEALGHLEAAALRWWKLYDPTETDTAPTNKQVSEWLQTERGLSQKMAESIASILRADGIRTGPR